MQQQEEEWRARQMAGLYQEQATTIHIPYCSPKAVVYPKKKESWRKRFGKRFPIITVLFKLCILYPIQIVTGIGELK